MDVFTQAVNVTADLARAVAALEVHCAEDFGRAVPDREAVRAAIHAVWPRLIEDAQHGRVSPRVEYVASLYERLAAEVGLEDSGIFEDRTDIPWFEFYTAGCGDEPRCEDAWVIAELFWGGYIRHLQLTLAWLLMNAIRIQHELPAIVPTPESTESFTDYLRWSGPETYDAESLRGLFYEYEKRVNG